MLQNELRSQLLTNSEIPSPDPPNRLCVRVTRIREECPWNREDDGYDANIVPNEEGIFSMRSSHSLDRLDVIFDDEHAVADAGLTLPATLADASDSRDLIEECVDLGDAADTLSSLRSYGRPVRQLVFTLSQ